MSLFSCVFWRWRGKVFFGRNEEKKQSLPLSSHLQARAVARDDSTLSQRRPSLSEKAERAATGAAAPPVAEPAAGGMTTPKPPWLLLLPAAEAETPAPVPPNPPPPAPPDLTAAIRLLCTALALARACDLSLSSEWASSAGGRPANAEEEEW